MLFSNEANISFVVEWMNKQNILEIEKNVKIIMVFDISSINH